MMKMAETLTSVFLYPKNNWEGSLWVSRKNFQLWTTLVEACDIYSIIYSKLLCYAVHPGCPHYFVLHFFITATGGAHNSISKKIGLHFRICVDAHDGKPVEVLTKTECPGLVAVNGEWQHITFTYTENHLPDKVL